MENPLPTQLSSSISCFPAVKRFPVKLHPSVNLRSANGFCLLVTVSSVLLLLLTFTVTPSAAVAQRPRSNSNPHLKNLASCSSDYDCDTSSTFLKCHQKVCQCPTINHFDEDKNRCLIRVGGSCTPKNTRQFCVAYAECSTQGKGYGTQGECKCTRRYKETIDNLCVSGARNRNQFNLYFVLSLPLVVVLLQFAGQRKVL